MPTGSAVRPAEGWWPVDPDRLLTLQRTLATTAAPAWEPVAAAVLGGSAVVAFGPVGAGVNPGRDPAPAGAGRGWAGACRLPPVGDAEVVVAADQFAAPYVPGRLAAREGPLREMALRRLSALPDVLLVNATGRDHPAGAGLALHLGAVLDVPSVGVTDRPLVATGTPPAGTERGAHTPLRLDGTVVGWWVRTRAGTRPVVVHAGWRTDAEMALAVVLAAAGPWRVPEPLRRALRAARQARVAATRVGGRAG